MLFPDGKVIAGGYFDAYNGSAVPRNLVRLNANGSVDASFNTGNTGFTNTFVVNGVSALAMQVDSKLVVGGTFSQYNGSTVPGGLIRLNANGSLDASFNAGGTGMTGIGVAPYDLKVQPDGKILVGGNFSNYNGSTTPYNLLRITQDGLLDATFNGGNLGFDSGVVFDMALQPDGKLLVGGNFTSYNGTTAPYFLVRLNANGSRDVTFNGNNRGFSAIHSVNALLLQPDGKVVVGGEFGSYNGVLTPLGFVRLNADGSLNDTATPLAGATFVFNPGNTAGATRAVSTAGTYTATATDPATGCTYLSNAVVVTAAPLDLVISNAQTIPAGTYHDITMTGPTTGGAGVATLGGAITVTGTVTVQAGGSLLTNCQALTGGSGTSFVLAAGGTLGICDAGGIAASGATGAIQTSTRSFAAAATYVYNGTAAQVTGTGLPATVETLVVDNPAGPVQLTQAVALTRELRLTRGPLDLNGRGLTLLSDATATAQVNQDGTTTTGTVTGGSATVQRFVPANGNAGLGYRHFASPVSSNTLADLAVPGGFAPVFNPTYNNSLASGATTPFPTVFGFDPGRVGTAPSSYTGFDQGWYSPATGPTAAPVPNAFTPGRGYATNLAANQTVDFVGPLNQTAVAMVLPRAAGTSAPDDNKGWHLLGNPFASSFALASLDNTPGVDNAKYVAQSTGPYAGGYDTYLTGVGGQPLLALGQGFFARTSTPGTTPTLAFALSGRRVDFTTNATFHRATAETRPLLELALTNAAATLRDRTTLYADARATAGLDPAHDAVKLSNGHGLNLSQQVAGQRLALNALPAFAAATEVPLAMGVPTAGTYSLQVNQLLNLPTGLVAFLTDAATGQTVNLSQQPSYSFNVSTAQAVALMTARFTLRFNSQLVLATAQELTAAAVTLFPNPAHRSFTLGVPALAGQREVRATLFKALGQNVATRTIGLGSAGATAEFQTAALAPGVYTLRLQAAAQVLTKRVVIE